MYVIFYNNKPIYLSDNEYNCGKLKSVDFKSVDIFKMLNQLKNDKLNGFCLTDKNTFKLYQNFTKHFKVIEAAGGLVFNEANDLLFIFRNGVWDLPKGKIEKGELTTLSALREVEEECNVQHLQLGNFVDKTYHIYEYKNKLIFKITHWFKMTCDGNQKLAPQLEEGITKVEFLDKKMQTEALKNTYTSIKILIDNFNKKHL